MDSNISLGDNMTLEKEPSLTIRAGSTTYVIGLYFNDKTNETIEDKVRKLIRKDMESGNF